MIETPDQIEIPYGRSPQPSRLIARFMFYIPMRSRNYKVAGIQGYRLIKDDVSSVAALYPDFDRDDRFVWFSEKPSSSTCYKIDLSKLNPHQLRMIHGEVIYRGDVPACAIVAIAHPPTLNEKQRDNVVSLIRKNCSQFLSSWNPHEPLFCDIHDLNEYDQLYPDTTKYLQCGTRSSSLPGTGTTFPVIISRKMKSNGINATPTNSTIMSGNPRTFTGGVYVAFPIDGFDISWSKNIAEMASHFVNSDRYHSRQYPLSHAGNALRVSDYWNDVSDGFSVSGLREAIHSGNNIFVTGTFYAISVDEFIKHHSMFVDSI